MPATTATVARLVNMLINILQRNVPILRIMLYFICKELSIKDDPDFGCNIEFSDSLDNEKENIDDIINSTEKYLLIFEFFDA